MARVAVQLTNFTGGELSPRLDGRNDLAKYPTGSKTLENFIVYPRNNYSTCFIFFFKSSKESGS